MAFQTLKLIEKMEQGDKVKMKGCSNTFSGFKSQPSTIMQLWRTRASEDLHRQYDPWLPSSFGKLRHHAIFPTPLKGAKDRDFGQAKPTRCKAVVYVANMFLTKMDPILSSLPRAGARTLNTFWKEFYL